MILHWKMENLSTNFLFLTLSNVFIIMTLISKCIFWYVTVLKITEAAF